MATQLKSYICDQWVTGSGNAKPLYNPTTEEVVAEVCTDGFDYAQAFAYARAEGGPTLRNMSFAQRGELLKSICKAVHGVREELVDLAIANGGNTRGDAKFDIDGATFTLTSYAKLGQKLGESSYLADGSSEQIAMNPRYVGRHIKVPVRGAALHINAFNFPAWGLAEKAAVSILAGVPVVTKPATNTSVVAARMMEAIVAANVLPKGVLSMVIGSGSKLVQQVQAQDVVAFTGSADTGFRIRSQENLLRNSVRVNIEADSLNSVVLGPDVKPGSETWDMFLRELAKEITQKAGQKCTATRRVFVPTNLVEAVGGEISKLLRDINVGNPAVKGVKMGPLATADQHKDILSGIESLGKISEVLYDGRERDGYTEVEKGKGYFVSPTFLYTDDGHNAHDVHNLEVFGPVSTMVAYNGEVEDAAKLVALGQGSLVASIYSDKWDFAQSLLLELSPYSGRITIGSKKIAEYAPGPGTVLPTLVHGGPGRAGGGEELGGLRGLDFYMQRSAVQGYQPWLEKLG